MAPLDAAPPSATRSQTIYRNVTPDEPYTRLPNAMLRNTALDLDERGALAMILSLPKHWDFSEEHFCRENRIGRDRCRRIVRSLETAGHCRRHQERAAGGKLGSAVYLFSAVPGAFGTVDGKPVNGSPSTGKPATGEPTTANSTREIKEREKETIEETLPTGESAQARHAPADEAISDEHIQVEVTAEPVQVEPELTPPPRQPTPAAPAPVVIDMEAVEIEPPKPTTRRAPKTKKARAKHVQHDEPCLLDEVEPKRTRVTRWTLFPSDEWVESRTPHWIDFSVQAGLTEDDARLLILRLVDHYRRSKGKSDDWDRTVKVQWLAKDAKAKRDKAAERAASSTRYTRTSASEQANAKVDAMFGGA